jgi:membrane associated rhomboid family serine protease
MQITPMVKQLIIINVLVFIGSQILGDSAYTYLSLFSFGNPYFKPWQLLTHIFMHAPIYPEHFTHTYNLAHIAFNMFALYSFGSALEAIWGSKKFLFFYISCGIGAGLVQNGVNFYLQDINSMAVGASGAIYGLLIAFAFLFPEARLAMFFIPVPIKAKYFIPILVGFDLFSGVTGSSIFGGGNIGHFAHVGGALIGFIIMWYWKKNSFNDKRWN